jgi:hypothetical protein
MKMTVSVRIFSSFVVPVPGMEVSLSGIAHLRRAHPTNHSLTPSLHIGMLIFGKVLTGSLADRLGLLKSYLLCMAGLIYDWTKSYSLAFALYIGLCLIAAAAGIAVMTRGGKK